MADHRLALQPLKLDAYSKPTFIRASLIGLCVGFVIIGFLENTSRFKSPERLAATPSSAATLEAIELSSRSDRLDVD